MRTFTAVIERCPETGLLVGHVPGLPGAHAQGATEEEVLSRLTEVVQMLLEAGVAPFCGEFVGCRTITVP